MLGWATHTTIQKHTHVGRGHTGCSLSHTHTRWSPKAYQARLWTRKMDPTVSHTHPVTPPASLLHSIYKHGHQTHDWSARLTYPLNATTHTGLHLTHPHTNHLDSPDMCKHQSHRPPHSTPIHPPALMYPPIQPCTHPHTTPHPRTIHTLSSAQTPINSTRSTCITTDPSRPPRRSQTLVRQPNNSLLSIGKHHHHHHHWLARLAHQFDASPTPSKYERLKIVICFVCMGGVPFLQLGEHPED